MIRKHEKSHAEGWDLGDMLDQSPISDKSYQKGLFSKIFQRLLGLAGSLLCNFKVRFVFSVERTVYPEESVRIPAIKVTLMCIHSDRKGRTPLTPLGCTHPPEQRVLFASSLENREGSES